MIIRIMYRPVRMLVARVQAKTDIIPPIARRNLNVYAIWKMPDTCQGSLRLRWCERGTPYVPPGLVI